MEELEVKVRPSQDDWVPQPIILSNTKRGSKLAIIGLQIQVKAGTLDYRVNPQTGDVEYKISKKGKKMKMDWRYLNR